MICSLKPIHRTLTFVLTSSSRGRHSVTLFLVSGCMFAPASYYARIPTMRFPFLVSLSALLASAPVIGLGVVRMIIVHPGSGSLNYSQMRETQNQLTGDGSAALDGPDPCCQRPVFRTRVGRFSPECIGRVESQLVRTFGCWNGYSTQVRQDLSGDQFTSQCKEGKVQR